MLINLQKNTVKPIWACSQVVVKGIWHFLYADCLCDYNILASKIILQGK